jgi:tetratricopeptide (TPR) repeat protein
MVASAFFLLSLLGYLKANAPVSVRRNPARWTIFSTCADLLSLLAGPSGLLLPVILLIIDIYPLKRLAGQRSGLRSAAGQLICQKAPYLLLSVASLCWVLPRVITNQSPGQPIETTYLLGLVLESAPERNATRVKLGTLLGVEGRLGEAAEILTAAAKADPKDGRIALKLGQVLAAQGKLNEAVRYFGEAVRLRPEDAEAHESLGSGLLELGKKDEAAKYLREALRILRSSPAAR